MNWFDQLILIPPTCIQQAAFSESINFAIILLSENCCQLTSFMRVQPIETFQLLPTKHGFNLSFFNSQLDSHWFPCLWSISPSTLLAVVNNDFHDLTLLQLPLPSKVLQTYGKCFNEQKITENSKSDSSVRHTFFQSWTTLDINFASMSRGE